MLVFANLLYDKSFFEIWQVNFHGKEIYEMIAVKIHATSAEITGKITRSFKSWLTMLKPYFLPAIALSVSGK